MIARPVRVSAQTPKEELQAKINVNRKSNNGYDYVRIATKEALEGGRNFDFQRVEITGIIATNDGNEYGPRKMFDLSLHPSHNDDGTEPPPNDSWFFTKWWYEFHHLSGSRQDVSDLFDDKTGKLTLRGREILAPLIGKDVHVNEIVAHSWGAVLLNNAIREGLINPPKTIYVVGVPDMDVVKWKQLALYTGTKVVVCNSRFDLAVKAADLKDMLDNLDIQGARRDYNNGNIHTAWSHWRDSHTPLANGAETFSLYHMNEEWDRYANITGHNRSVYFMYLERIGILSQSTDDLWRIQREGIENRTAELFERDVQKEIAKIRNSRPEPPAASNPRAGTPSESSPSCFIVCPPPAVSIPPPAAAPPAAAPAPGAPAESVEDSANRIKELAVQMCDDTVEKLDNRDLLEAVSQSRRGRVEQFSRVLGELSTACEKEVYGRIATLIKEGRVVDTDGWVAAINGFYKEYKSSRERQGPTGTTGGGRPQAREKHCHWVRTSVAGAGEWWCD